jgi:amino acid adenylation domain-containing protein
MLPTNDIRAPVVSLNGVTCADSVEWPLTATQMGIWIDEQLAADPTRYNWGEYLCIPGPLHLPQLRDAIQHVVHTTEALRLRLFVRGGIPTQQLALHLPIDLPVVDLRSSARPREDAFEWMELDLARPFDRPDDQLFSFTLLRIADCRWFLCAKYHHVIMDGMSAMLVWRRIAQTYNALLAGKTPTPFAGHSWADVVALDLEYATSQEKQGDRAYWITRGRGPGDVPGLSTRTAVGQPPGPARRLTTTVASDRIQALRRVSESVSPDCRLNHVLFALLYVYVARLTGTEDLGIALPRASRRTRLLSETAGMLTNVALVRVQFPMNDSLRNLLALVSRTLRETAIHERFPFGELVRELAPADARQSRHYPAVLNYLPGLGRLDFGGVQSEVVMLSPGPCRDLQVLFRSAPPPEPGALQLFFPGNLYTAEEAELHQKRLLHLLLAAPDYLDTPLWKIPLVPPEERNKTVVLWNQTDHAYPEPKSLHQLFEEQVPRSAGSIALADEERELTYEAANAQADHIARELCSNGVAAGDLVGLWDRWSLESVVGLVGILKAGAAYVPLPADVPQERLRAVLADANVKCIVSCESLAHLALNEPILLIPAPSDEPMPADRSGGELESSGRAAFRVDLEHGPAGERLACVLYTSGTTGRPKGVCLTHAGVVNVLLHRTQSRFLPGDFAISPLTAPFHFDASLVQMFSPLTTGGTLVVTRSLESLAKSRWYHRLTALTGAPSLVSCCCSLGGVPRSARVVGFGAEPIPRPLLDTLIRSGTVQRIFTGYGLTECSCYSTDVVLHEGGDAQSAATLGEYVDRRVIGRPIRNTKLYVLDTHLEPVPIGVAGELYIGGAGVAHGYLSRPKITNDTFVRSPFRESSGSRLCRTGDRVRWRPDGNLEFLGRLDHQVKLRGLRIELGEIEAALASHPAVQACAAMLRDDARGDASLAAYFVPANGQVPAPGDMRRFLAEKLPEYMVPSAFVVLESLPLLPNGKVDRGALPGPDVSSAIEENKSAPPRTPLEQALATIWADVLGLKHIGVRDNFFALGGHSLRAIQLMNRIEREFNKVLPVTTLFENATIETLARVIDGAATEVQSEVVRIQPLGSKPPLFVVHGIGGDLLYAHLMARHLGADQPVYGLQTVGDEELRFQDMASRLVNAVRRTQPEGPYHLCGHCFGGMLAFEMARQLGELGCEVGLLAVLDELVSPARRSILNWTYVILRFLANVPFRFADVVYFDPPDRLLSRIKDRLQRLLREILARMRKDRAALSLADIVDVDRLRPGDVGKWQRDAKAVQDYRPVPYDGRLLLVRARTRPLFSGFDHDLGWGRLVKGPADVRVVPGNHANMLHEPQIGRIADIFAAELAADDQRRVRHASAC